VAEFFDVIGPLSDPVAHGGEAADAFHVVAPSLPGYGFSGPTTELGWNIERTARAFVEVMDRLGYDRFFAQGGDWGSFVSSSLATAFPNRVAAVHLNLVMAGPPDDNPTEEEKAEAAKLATFVATESGYQGIHATKPQTLAYGLTDSPAGLAGWILEKFHGWSGPDGDQRFNLDRLLDNISIYWLTGTINSSMRMYYEMMNPLTGARLRPRPLDVPVGIGRYPDEPFTAPRRWVEATHHPVYVSEPPAGGHFPAMQVPQLFVDDLRAFFRSRSFA
jgi:epoxide hydrolase